MSGELKGRKIAILATDGFEQVELTDPRKNVEAAGATTEVLSVKDGSTESRAGSSPTGATASGSISR